MAVSPVSRLPSAWPFVVGSQVSAQIQRVYGGSSPCVPWIVSEELAAKVWRELKENERHTEARLSLRSHRLRPLRSGRMGRPRRMINNPRINNPWLPGR